MAEQIDSLKAVLQNKRSELARSIRAQRSHLSVDESDHELIDRMQGMSRRDEAVTFLDTLTRTLADVDDALMAIKEGSYGICAECGEPIANRRLKAIPWAGSLGHIARNPRHAEFIQNGGDVLVFELNRAVRPTDLGH